MVQVHTSVNAVMYEIVVREYLKYLPLFYSSIMRLFHHMRNLHVAARRKRKTSDAVTWSSLF
jgi:hypothetical protein